MTLVINKLVFITLIASLGVVVANTNHNNVSGVDTTVASVRESTEHNRRLWFKPVALPKLCVLTTGAAKKNELNTDAHLSLLAACRSQLDTASARLGAASSFTTSMAELSGQATDARNKILKLQTAVEQVLQVVRMLPKVGPVIAKVTQQIVSRVGTVVRRVDKVLSVSVPINNAVEAADRKVTSAAAGVAVLEAKAQQFDAVVGQGLACEATCDTDVFHSAADDGLAVYGQIRGSLEACVTLVGGLNTAVEDWLAARIAELQSLLAPFRAFVEAIEDAADKIIAFMEDAYRAMRSAGCCLPDAVQVLGNGVTATLQLAFCPAEGVADFAGEILDGLFAAVMNDALASVVDSLVANFNFPALDVSIGGTLALPVPLPEAAEGCGLPDTLVLDMTVVDVDINLNRDLEATLAALQLEDSAEDVLVSAAAAFRAPCADAADAMSNAGDTCSGECDSEILEVGLYVIFPVAGVALGFSHVIADALAPSYSTPLVADLTCPPGYALVSEWLGESPGCDGSCRMDRGTAWLEVQTSNTGDGAKCVWSAGVSGEKVKCQTCFQHTSSGARTGTPVAPTCANEDVTECPAPYRAAGAICERDEQCVSGGCAYGTTDRRVCCSGQDSWSLLGTAHQWCVDQPDGGACWHDDAQCASGYCDETVCRPKLATGEACAAMGHCASGVCAQSADNAEICCASRFESGLEWWCERLDVGQACYHHESCDSGFCGGGVCSPKVANGVACSEPADCVSGVCSQTADNNLKCCASRFSAGAEWWCERLSNGDACYHDESCDSGRCSGGVCTAKKAKWTSCSSATDCSSGVCAQTADNVNRCCGSRAHYLGEWWCENVPAGKGCYWSSYCAGGSCSWAGSSYKCD